MSTESLLPSYGSIICSQHNHHSTSISQGITISASPIIQSLSFLIFTATAIVCSLWVWQSERSSDSAPSASVPLLPYLALLCLVISLACWVGYLFFISYDAAGGPRVQRRIVIYTSLVGKAVLAVAHVCIGFYYMRHFQNFVQPNWVLVFLAVQTWWDFLLFVVYSCLRGLDQTR